MSWASLCPYKEINKNYVHPEKKQSLMKVISVQAAKFGKDNMEPAFPTVSPFKMEVFGESGKGLGVIAMEDIPSNTCIMEYIGEMKMELGENNFRAVMLGDGLYIDGHEMGNAGRLLNHSCDGNLRLERVWSKNKIRAFFFTKRGIKAGDELTWNYFFELRPKEKNVLCNCKTKKCRLLMGIRKKKQKRTYKCTTCDKIFESDYYLKRHKDKHVERKRKKYTCSICTEKFFKFKDNCIRHEKYCKNKNEGKDEETFECDMCHTIYNRKDNLVSHQKRFCKGPLPSDTVNMVAKKQRSRKVGKADGQQIEIDLARDELTKISGGAGQAVNKTKSKGTVGRKRVVVRESLIDMISDPSVQDISNMMVVSGADVVKDDTPAINIMPKKGTGKLRKRGRKGGSSDDSSDEDWVGTDGKLTGKEKTHGKKKTRKSRQIRNSDEDESVENFDPELIVTDEEGVGVLRGRRNRQGPKHV